MARKKISKAQHLYDFALLMIDEAESNILEAYEGTSSEDKIKETYSEKRKELNEIMAGD